MNKREKMKAIIKVLKKLYHKDNAVHFPAKNKFMLLVGTILSQRTRDENTVKAEKSLFSEVKNPKEILSLPLNRLEKIIKPSGMYRQKAKRIKAVARIILEKYKGRVPRTREELISLPSVGFKTADIVLSYGYGIPTIAIDTHCNRIPKRIGIINQEASVEEVRKELEKLTPLKDRLIVNHGLVRFGQTICRPVGPKCSICPFRHFCRYCRMIRCSK
jgi:endonuclease-3